MKNIIIKNSHCSLRKSGLIWIWISFIVFLLDFATKYIVKKYLLVYSPVPVFSFLNLTLSYNKGVAFGILNSASGWQTWLFGSIAILFSIGMLLYLRHISYKQRAESIALAMIIGGALGNFFDRANWGQVTDFIQFHISNWYFAIFNIADSAICLGAAILLLAMAVPHYVKQKVRVH